MACLDEGVTCYSSKTFDGRFTSHVSKLVVPILNDLLHFGEYAMTWLPTLHIVFLIGGYPGFP